MGSHLFPQDRLTRPYLLFRGTKAGEICSIDRVPKENSPRRTSQKAGLPAEGGRKFSWRVRLRSRQPAEGARKPRVARPMPFSTPFRIGCRKRR